MKNKVVLVKSRRGFDLISFDFTDNIFIPFYGKGSLWRAKLYAQQNGLTIMNLNTWDCRRNRDEGTESTKIFT